MDTKDVNRVILTCIGFASGGTSLYRMIDPS